MGENKEEWGISKDDFCRAWISFGGSKGYVECIVRSELAELFWRKEKLEKAAGDSGNDEHLRKFMEHFDRCSEAVRAIEKQRITRIRERIRNDYGEQ